MHKISDKTIMIWLQLNSHMTETADLSQVSSMILGVSLGVNPLRGELS